LPDEVNWDSAISAIPPFFMPERKLWNDWSGAVLPERDYHGLGYLAAPIASWIFHKGLQQNSEVLLEYEGDYTRNSTDILCSSSFHQRKAERLITDQRGEMCGWGLAKIPNIRRFHSEWLLEGDMSNDVRQVVGTK